MLRQSDQTRLIIVFIILIIQNFNICFTKSNIYLFNEHYNNGNVCNIRIPNEEKLDCHPDPAPTDKVKVECLQRGCCFKPSNTKEKYYRPISIPWCYFPSNYSGYILEKKWENSTTQTLSSTAIKKTSSGWPSDVNRIQVDVNFKTCRQLNIKIYDPKVNRYTVPIELYNKPIKNCISDHDFMFVNNPFGVRVWRKSSKEIIFDSAISQGPLIFADQFLQITTRLSSEFVYGLGEHVDNFLKNVSSGYRKQFTFWARDQPPKENANLYGSHAFLINKEDTFNFHAIFLLNSNAMDVDLQSGFVTFRTIGGIFDFYIFTANNLQDITTDYHSLLGSSYIPPYWALGFHLCRWGYKNASRLNEIINRNRNIKLPYDVQWTDIEYMDKHLDWTLSKVDFKQLPDVVKNLHDYGQRYIMIVDPAISSSQVPGYYQPYEDGLEMDIFIKDDRSNKPLVGKVWPGLTTFPDFFHVNATKYWLKSAQKLYQVLPFDGLWIDMNEPSNFVHGSITGCSKTKWNFPPYLPGINSNDLFSNTVCPSAKHQNYLHYDVHSMYGLSEMKVSDNVLRTILKKRSVIISRSTFPSSGRYGGHWSGDVYSNWHDLKYSIPTLLNFQMFAIPFMGADICGFAGNVTEELCVRWMQLGSFYPFMRNHNDLTSIDQDPGAFSKEAQQIIKRALQIRYSFLPYLYTLFFDNHLNGKLVARALIFNYPNDTNVYNIDEQFMWGNSILISPVLNRKQKKLKIYLPTQSNWYDFYNGSLIRTNNNGWINIPVNISSLPIHIAEGHIIPMLPGDVHHTKEQITNPFQLLVTMSSKYNITGELFWDDGESLDTLEQKKVTHFQFYVVSNKLYIKCNVKGYLPSNGISLNFVRIFGVENQVKNATVNGKSAQLTYDKFNKVATLSDFTENMLNDIVITWT